MTFQELKLIPPLLAAVEALGYVEPSPIQKQAIPVLLEGRDLIGCAQTGTGKTAAFALPILQQLSETEGTGIRALVLTPTRELALQIYESFVDYGAKLRLRCAVIFGGVGQNPQVAALKRGVDILVATPGRLNDLIGQGYVDLRHIEIFVLDEADRMLDMGFINDVRRVIHKLPAERQTLLFSATMPREIEQLAATILHEPATVKVDPVTSTVDAIRQSICFVDKGNKKYLLRDYLKGGEVRNALVFTRTKHGANRVVKELAGFGIEALAIHGNKSQTARQEALTRFKKGSIRVLVATDIAARGIDVPELSHVFNYDLPNEPETYIHRIGRTGRAGLGGDAISFCCYDELEYYEAIEALTGLKIPVQETKYPMQVFAAGEKSRPAQRGGRQSRPSRPAQSKPAQAAREETGSAAADSAPPLPTGSCYGRIELPGALKPKESAGSQGAPRKRRRRRRRPGSASKNGGEAKS